MPRMFNKIGFIMCQHSIETNPVLKSAIEYFVNQGINVDVYVENLLMNRNFQIEGGNLYNFDIQFHRKKIFKKILYKFRNIFLKLDHKFGFSISGNRSFPLRLLTLIFVPNIFIFGKKLKRYLTNYDYYIVADAFSLLPLYLNMKRNALRKVIYWNLELTDDMDLFFIKDVLKKNLDLFYLSIIQDEEREKSFNQFLGLHHKFLKVPVTIIPPSRKIQRDFFEKNYGIKNKFIVLYSGYICLWAGLLEVSDAFMDIHDDFILVIQGRTEGTESYLNLLQNKIKSQSNILLLPQYFDDEEHNHLIASADAGLALYLYHEHNDNFNLISNSSGKIATYLGHGLPVITNNLKSLQELSDKSGCTFCLSSFSELGSKLKYIKNNKDKISERCLDYFNSNYNFNVFFEKVYTSLGY